MIPLMAQFGLDITRSDDGFEGKSLTRRLKSFSIRYLKSAAYVLEQIRSSTLAFGLVSIEEKLARKMSE